MAEPPATEQEIAALQRSQQLCNQLVDLINAEGSRPGAHPATQLSALVHAVASVLHAYGVPPSVFVNRVIIAMAALR